MLGWKIFSVEYRLAPENRFPIPLEDCDQSMDWLIENADKFEIDADKIAVGGDSAGGNIAACLCIKRIEEGILAIFEKRSTLTRTKIKRNWDRKDWSISSDEALNLGLVDEIRGEL